MLGGSATTQQDYPQWSGFGPRREREWGHWRQQAAGPTRRTHPCAATSSANDGIAMCRKAPATVSEGEIVVASKEELHAAPLSGKRLLALWERAARCR